MDARVVEERIREIIANVANVDAAAIGGDDSFTEDLDLDSLSLLEIGVDVDYEFKLGVPEERLQQLKTVKDTVQLVMEHASTASAV